MSREIRIKGGLVEWVDIVVKKSIATNEFMDNIKDCLEIDTGILPKNCIFCQKVGGKTYYIMEYPPQLMKIKYKPATRTADVPVQNVHVSLPFLQFYISHDASYNTLGKLSLTCTKKRVSTMEDSIFVAPLLNQFGNGHSDVCLGDSSPVDMGLPINTRVDKVINTYFNSEFNTDIKTDWHPSLVFKDGDKTVSPSIEAFILHSKKNKMYGIASGTEYVEHKRKTVGKMIMRMRGL